MLDVCLQEREVKIGGEERTRMKPRRESWCSRKMDKVRVQCGKRNVASAVDVSDLSVTHGVFVLHRIRSSYKNAG